MKRKCWSAYKQGTGYILELLFPFPPASSFFHSNQYLIQKHHCFSDVIHISLTVKPNCLSYCGRGRRKEAVRAAIHYSVAYALYSLHTTLLPSPNPSSDHTTAIWKETAKFLNILLLNTPLHLWKESPKDHNLAYKASATNQLRRNKNPTRCYYL